ncbi:MAG: DUF5684 domain-containing protein [Candidatus Brocadiia bacterium]
MDALMSIAWLAVVVFEIAAIWRVFSKAGQPGWGALIPIYNVYCLLQIAGRPGWWLLLFFIPVVNMIVGIIVALDVARNFGQSAAFGIGLILLPIIFYPILAFGSAQYGGVPA